jgi:ketosteroid isomerase-like protein
MAQENVETVREAFAAFNRGDFETAVGAFDPEAEWIPYLSALEGSVFRGRAALLEMWNDINDNLGGNLRVELEELVDCGDQVVAVVEAIGSGTGSGVEVHQRWAQLASLRDGLIVRVEPFATRAAALEAAGLRE